WVGQLFVDFRTGKLSTRGKNNGTWQAHRFMWDNLNDGSGSGLDADLLDGNQASAFLLKSGGVVTGNTNFTGGVQIEGNQIWNGSDTWCRLPGDTGVYFPTYGGGVHMSDGTWVRIYNGKALYVANQIAATGNITAYYSDERLKTKTGKIENALEKVQSLSGFTYVENELARSLGYVNENEQVALSAQDVQKVMPQAVSLAPCDMKTEEFTGVITSKSGEDYLTIDYARLVPLLVEAIKEQQELINKLTSRLDDIEKGE
ncbi:MAG: tail fiber domain-containing protein, partial [Methylophagaceae bacterium]